MKLIKKLENPEKWKKFFLDMASGLLPYIKLFVKQNQVGGGMGNVKPSRFYVPVLSGKTFYQTGKGQSGRCKPYAVISNTAQTVQQAKEEIKREPNKVLPLDQNHIKGFPNLKIKYKRNQHRRRNKRLTKSTNKKRKIITPDIFKAFWGNNVSTRKKPRYN